MPVRFTSRVGFKYNVYGGGFAVVYYILPIDNIITKRRDAAEERTLLRFMCDTGNRLLAGL
jgi:hypothetical protein